MESLATGKSCISGRHAAVANRSPPRPPFKWFPYYKDVCSLCLISLSALQDSHSSNPCLWIMAPKAHSYTSLAHRRSITATCHMWTSAYPWLSIVWSEPISDIGRLPAMLPLFLSVTRQNNN